MLSLIVSVRSSLDVDEKWIRTFCLAEMSFDVSRVEILGNKTEAWELSKIVP